MTFTTKTRTLLRRVLSRKISETDYFAQLVALLKRRGK